MNMIRAPLFFLIIISLFSVLRAQQPVYGILIDNTGSMRVHFERELSFAKEIVSQIPEGSRVSLFRFETASGTPANAVLQVVLTCSIDKTAVKRQIDSLYVLGGQTTLMDAAYSSIEVLTAKPETCGNYTERNLILISDGEDRTSMIKFEDLKSSLNKSQIRVSAIGLTGQLEGKSRKLAKNFLEKITSETGGIVVFPENGQKPMDVVKQLLTINVRPSK